MGVYHSRVKFHHDIYKKINISIIALIKDTLNKDYLEDIHYTPFSELFRDSYMHGKDLNLKLDINFKNAEDFTLKVYLPYTQTKVTTNTSLLKHFKEKELSLTVREINEAFLTPTEIKIEELYGYDGYPTSVFTYNTEDLNLGETINVTYDKELSSYPGISIKRTELYGNCYDNIRDSVKRNKYIKVVDMSYYRVITKVYYTGTEEEIIKMDTTFGTKNLSSLNTTNKRLLGIS